MDADVVAIGAGLAGLVCARDLARSGIECLVLESWDWVGGRVPTDAFEDLVAPACAFDPIARGYELVTRRVHAPLMLLVRPQVVAEWPYSTGPLLL